MEALLRSLRNLSLSPPSPSQLLELLDEDTSNRSRLAQLLSLNLARSTDAQDGEDGGGGMGMDTASFMGQDLLNDAVRALLENFARDVARQKANWEREKQLLLKPQKHKPVPRRALLLRQAADLKRHEEEWTQSRGFWPKLVFDGGATYHSTRSLDQLERIGVKELDKVPARYEGKYLLCRILTPLAPYVGVSTLVEDPSGDVMPLSISHFSSNYNLTAGEASRMLPPGTLMAVREPYLSSDFAAKTGPCAGKATSGVRVDSPTDIVVLQPGDEMLQGVEWKGNLEEGMATLAEPVQEEEIVGLQWMDDGPLSRASRHPGGTKAPQGTDAASTKKLVSALLRQERPGAAWRELCAARKLGVVSDEDDEVKLLEAKTLYLLGAIGQAVEAFEKVQGPTRTTTAKATDDHLTSILDLDASECLCRARSRLSESLSGPTPSSVRSLYFSSSSTSTPRLDAAHYVGPVQVSLIDGAYRGLVTTRDTQPGEILLTCRAVGASYPDDQESRGSPTIRLNLENGVVSTTSQVRAQTRVLHALFDRPELALPFMGLTAGPSTPYSTWATQPYPLHVSPVLSSNQALAKERLDLDAAYIDGVLRFNAFGPAQTPPKSNSKSTSGGGTVPSDVPSSADAGELGRSTMPHPLPAILNHACLPNVSSVFFGDVVTTRVLNPLPKGTEIVHQYVRGEEAFAVRRAQLSKHGFGCGCGLCKRDEADGEERRGRRARIVAGELPAVLERSRVVAKGRVPSAEEIAHGGESVEEEAEKRRDAHRDVAEALLGMRERIDETYDVKRDALRPDLFGVNAAAAEHLAAVGDGKGAVECEIKALQSVGAVPATPSSPALDVTPALARLPTLHFDKAIASMLRLAALLGGSAASISSSEMGTTATPQQWLDSAYGAHQCMIGGGRDVFLDRWEDEDAVWAGVLCEWKRAER